MVVGITAGEFKSFSEIGRRRKVTWPDRLVMRQAVAIPVLNHGVSNYFRTCCHVSYSFGAAKAAQSYKRGCTHAEQR